MLLKAARHKRRVCLLPFEGSNSKLPTVSFIQKKNVAYSKDLTKPLTFSEVFKRTLVLFSFF
jgi:hypothetical protein